MRLFHGIHVDKVIVLKEHKRALDGIAWGDSAGLSRPLDLELCANSNDTIEYAQRCRVQGYCCKARGPGPTIPEAKPSWPAGVGKDGPSRNDILDIINSFDIFVISSYHEGIPMVMLEAMALKKSIVATEVGGLVEMIDDNKSGLFVPANNPEAIADACLKLIKDKTLKNRLENNAANAVEQSFSLDHQVSRWIWQKM